DEGPLRVASKGALRFRWTPDLPGDPDRIYRRAGIRALPDGGGGPRGVGEPPEGRIRPRPSANRPWGAGHAAVGEGIPPLGSGFRRTSDPARGELRMGREVGPRFH